MQSTLMQSIMRESIENTIEDRRSNCLFTAVWRTGSTYRLFQYINFSFKSEILNGCVDRALFSCFRISRMTFFGLASSLLLWRWKWTSVGGAFFCITQCGGCERGTAGNFVPTVLQAVRVGKVRRMGFVRFDRFKRHEWISAMSQRLIIALYFGWNATSQCFKFF